MGGVKNLTSDGTRTFEWDRDEIATIRARIEPRYNARGLVVQSRDGSREEMLDHCPADDLKWVAALLRDTLGVPATPRFQRARSAGR